jgi:hypothetical protein
MPRTLDSPAHHTTYGIITEDKLDRNLDRMKTQWNPPTSIEILFTQINEGVAFTKAGGDTPTGPSSIRITYNIIATTGRFDVTTREWRAKTTDQNTWAAFQNHFKATDTHNRLLETSGTRGYHGTSNMTTTRATTQAALIASELALALALQAKITPYVASSTNLYAITPNTGIPAARTYCWTHGITTNRAHNIASYINKAQGHKDKVM